MEQVLLRTGTEIFLTISGFFGTNLENVVILITVYCARPVSIQAVRLGFILGSLLLLAISLLFLIIADWLPIRYLGLLGLIPLSIGLYELYKNFTSDGAKTTLAPLDYPRAKIAIPSALLMLANGGDTVAVFAPLFAETEQIGVIVMAITFIILTLLLSYFVGLICIHPQLSKPLKVYGPKLSPYIMIAIGIYIMFNTGTDLSPG